VARGEHPVRLHTSGRDRTRPPDSLRWARAELAFEPDGGLDDVSADRVARALTRPMGEFFASLLGRPLKSAALLEDVQL
jgi:hypothetical protein